MTAGEIAELVVSLYEARPEAKEYIDFFLNPDIDKKLDKARVQIKKELWRTARGRNRTRISHIRRVIKNISSLSPGAEAVCEIMTYATENACGVGSGQWVKETTLRALAKLLTDTVLEVHRAGLTNLYLPRIRSAIAAMRSDTPRYAEAKELFHDTLTNTLDSLL